MDNQEAKRSAKEAGEALYFAAHELYRERRAERPEQMHVALAAAAEHLRHAATELLKLTEELHEQVQELD
jgi:hypothetical protein